MQKVSILINDKLIDVCSYIFDIIQGSFYNFFNMYLNTKIDSQNRFHAKLYQR